MNRLLDMVNYIRDKRDKVKDKEEVIEMLETVGLNCEVLSEFPEKIRKHCRDKGLRIWQYPVQFAPYMLFMKNLPIEINSYLEIGSRWGGTFIFTVEFLNIKQSFALDPIVIPLHLLEYQKYNPNHEYLRMKSEDIRLKEVFENNKIDMVLIDGLHSYKGMSEDFRLCHRNNVKVIVCHDVASESCKETTECWNKFVKGEYSDYYDFYEFTDNYVPDVKFPFLGIGVCVRK